MSCQHEWVKISKNWRDYVCSKCDMDMSVGEYEALQQARREGWEQCQMECVDVAEEHASNPFAGAMAEKIADAIAAMEYGGEK